MRFWGKNRKLNRDLHQQELVVEIKSAIKIVMVLSTHGDF